MLEKLEAIFERYQFAEGTFDNYQFYLQGKRNIHICSRDIDLQNNDFLHGIPFLRVNMKYPKMASVAALKFGKYAASHVITLHEEQWPNFLQHKSFKIAPNQLLHGDPEGYMITMYQGHCVGMSFLGDQWDAIGLIPEAWEGFSREGLMDF